MIVYTEGYRMPDSTSISHNDLIMPSTRLTSRLMQLTLLGCILIPILAATCGCSPKQAAAANTAAPPPVPVATLTVQPQDIPVEFEVVGQTEGAKEVEVRARVSGILEKWLYQEGAAVSAGQALFQIEREPFEIALAQAKAQLAEAQAKVDQTAREARRLQSLLARKAISEREYDDAASSAKLDQATLQAAEAQVSQAALNLKYTLVTAPVAGVSGRALRSEGSLLTAGQDSSLLTTLAQIDPIWVRFSIAQAALAALQNASGPDRKDQIRLVLPDGSIYAEPGRLNFTASEVDAALGTVQLRAEFPNPKHRLLPGQFVRVRVDYAAPSAAFLIPQKAVLQGDAGRFVYVVGSDGKALMKNIAAAEWSGTNWVIRDGLAAGDQVIVDNLLKLRPGAAVSIVPAAPPK